MAPRQIDGKGSNDNADVVADLLWAVIFDSIINTCVWGSQIHVIVHETFL